MVSWSCTLGYTLVGYLELRPGRLVETVLSAVGWSCTLSSYLEMLYLWCVVLARPLVGVIWLLSGC